MDINGLKLLMADKEITLHDQAQEIRELRAKVVAQGERIEELEAAIAQNAGIVVKE